MPYGFYFCSRLCGALLLAATAVLAQPKALPTGQVIEKVSCQSDASQSYALYLPARYTPEKPWPILYGFDAGGRGKQPVELYREAAEKYGWIVVGSNNSRNGPGVPLNDIIIALWQDTHERLAVDDRRVYTTGMSGGARVATTVAIGLKDRVAGVIACGAGFPSTKTPQKDLHFAYFSIAGIEDFNLLELRQLVEPLAKAGMTHQLLTFDGEHTWPPSPILLEAVEWMEAQALKTGRSDKDEARINELYAQGWQRAQQFAAAGNLYEAWLRYRILQDAFTGLHAVDEATSNAQRLQSAKEVQTMQMQLKAADRQQETRSNEIATLLQTLDASETQMQATTNAKGLIAQWRKKAEEATRSTDRIAARRLLTQFAITLSEDATNALYRKNYSRAAALLLIAVEVRPNNPQTWYRLATAQAQSGEKKRALESLKHAIEKGFSDGARLEQAPEFAGLRQEQEFQALINRLKNATGN
ncbi:MAG: hypothetical protein U0Y68_19165 [Blastocatellia bacterium]